MEPDHPINPPGSSSRSHQTKSVSIEKLQSQAVPGYGRVYDEQKQHKAVSRQGSAHGLEGSRLLKRLGRIYRAWNQKYLQKQTHPYQKEKGWGSWRRTEENWDWEKEIRGKDLAFKEASWIEQPIGSACTPCDEWRRQCKEISWGEKTEGRGG